MCLLDPFATAFGTGTESFVGGFADFRNLEKVNLIPLHKTEVRVHKCFEISLMNYFRIHMNHCSILLILNLTVCDAFCTLSLTVMITLPHQAHIVRIYLRKKANLMCLLLYHPKLAHLPDHLLLHQVSLVRAVISLSASYVAKSPDFPYSIKFRKCFLSSFVNMISMH